jgi:hypothetical protein
VPTD